MSIAGVTPSVTEGEGKSRATVVVVWIGVTDGAVVMVEDGIDDEGGGTVVTGDTSTNDVVVKTVKVVKGGVTVVDVVVGNVSCVVVVVDDVNELDVDVSVVVVHTSIVVEVCGVYPSTVILYLTLSYHLSGMPQHIPARNLYVPGGKVISM